MPSPVLPDEFKNVIPRANDRPCDVENKMLQLSLLIWRFIDWMLNDDGSVSDEFKEEVGLIGGNIPIPTNVTATTDDPDKITVSWSSVAGATTYEVWRGEESNTATMVLVGDEISIVSYEDTDPEVGEVWFYAIKAVTSNGTSGFSGIAQGIRSVGGSGGEQDSYVFADRSNDLPVTVPTGRTHVDIYLWGNGGNGGASVGAPYVAPGGSVKAGGGGASGGFTKVIGANVTPGELYSLSLKNGAASFTGEGVTAIAYDGGAGGNGSWFVVGNVGQAGPSGSNQFTGGTPTFFQGNAGTGSTGGAAIVDGTRTAGAGGNGNPGGQIISGTYPGNNGSTGLIVIEFSA